MEFMYLPNWFILTGNENSQTLAKTKQIAGHKLNSNTRLVYAEYSNSKNDRHIQGFALLTHKKHVVKNKQNTRKDR